MFFSPVGNLAVVVEADPWQATSCRLQPVAELIKFGMRNLLATVGVLPACLFSLWSLLLCADVLIAPFSNQERDGRPPALL